MTAHEEYIKTLEKAFNGTYGDVFKPKYYFGPVARKASAKEKKLARIAQRRQDRALKKYAIFQREMLRQWIPLLYK